MKVIPFNGIGGMWPLFTKSDLAKRWNVTVQRLNNWETRHDDFPPRISGVMAGDTAVYGRADVESYEVNRGGADKVATYNAALGFRK